MFTPMKCTPAKFAPMIGLLAALAPASVLALLPALAQAQTNLDQGKSAAQIFASDCVECHKAPHSLANGKNRSALVDFLREHYTTSDAQAAALAAYVLGARGGEPIGGTAEGHGQKPAAERAGTATAERKPAKHEAKQSAKPEEGRPANAKLRRLGREHVKPKDEANRSEQPAIAGPEGRGHEHRSATASRNRRKEPKSPQPAPEPAAAVHAPPVAVTEPAAVEHPAAAIVTAPAPAEASSQQVSPSPALGQTPSAAAPAEAAPVDSGDNAPAPRDNIPD